MPQILMPYTVHLDHTMCVTPLNTLFVKGDSAAHRFELTILRAGVQEELTGCKAVCKFYRIADSAFVDVDGTIEDGKAVAVLNKACYDYIGRFVLTITIKNGAEETTVFYGDGYMHGQSADTSISGDYIIYDINTLLEKISEIDAATQAANTAASNANTATANANTATGKANTAANTANTAATNANTAKDAANAAAGKIDNMTVSANPVSTGTATAALSLVDGHYHLALGLPKGDTGATPQISVQVQTGAAGSEASVSVTGTAENPVIHLTIPRGDTGAIENLTINGKPVTSGTITLTAEDIGARPSTWTPTAEDVGALPSGGKADDASKLGGELPEYYIQHRNLVHNSNFRKFIAQSGIGDTHDATQAYAGDRWILDSGAVTGEENENGEGYSNITLNGTIRQKIADAPDVATAMIGMISGEATIIYANGELTITSDGGVIDWVLLVEGENVPASYIPPEYSAELLKCQTYYFCIGSVGNYALPIAPCIFSSTTSARIVVFLPTAMRVTPTVIYPDGELTISNGTDYKTFTSISVQGVRGTVLYLSATGSGYTSKETGIVRFVGVTNENHYIKFCSDM